MPSRPLPIDWRDETDYLPLLEADAGLMTWEWLRRNEGYREAAARAVSPAGAKRRSVRVEDPRAARWGLHAFEDPDLPLRAARPVWTRAWYRRVLTSSAQPSGDAADIFDIRRFADVARVVLGPGGTEHLLLSDGKSTLRVDVESGTLLDGPVLLSYRLAGLTAAEGPLDTLRRLLQLCRVGRLSPGSSLVRNRRLVTLLRAYDGLRTGAAQREVASTLLSREPLPVRWRTEVPSLRSQAQRLVHGARAMAAGGYRSLLNA